MPSKIYIYSQPIQTGKTSKLQNWVKGQSSIGGILTPDIHGKRVLHQIAANQNHRFELNASEQGTSIGRFVFDTTAFERARSILGNDIIQPFDWVIVDEVGRLELDRKEGLEPAVASLVHYVKNHSTSPKLMLVVRDYLLEKAMAYYQIENAILVDDAFFKLPESPVAGLVLCGGQSVRMGKDKAMITYHQLPQYAHVAQLMQSFCKDVFLSCNAQQKDLFNKQYRSIEDNATFLNAGPMTGLLSAFDQLENSALLVMGCDYPHFTKADMQALMAARDEQTDAVCYHKEASGFDEPLLAIYEKQCAPLLLQFYQNGQTSLQQFLKTIRTKRIIAANPQSLISVDS